jgi:hypothetical protein
MDCATPRIREPGVTFEAIVIQVELANGTFVGDVTNFPEQRPMSRGK